MILWIFWTLAIVGMTHEQYLQDQIQKDVPTIKVAPHRPRLGDIKEK